MEKLPHWDLDPIYPGLASHELAQGFADLTALMGSIDTQHRTTLATLSTTTPVAKLARALGQTVELFNTSFLLATTLQVYVDSIVYTDSFDAEAAKKLSELEILQVGLRQAWTRFQGWIHTISPVLPRVLVVPGPAHEHTFILRETAEQAAYLMGEREEMLAAELNLRPHAPESRELAGLSAAAYAGVPWSDRGRLSSYIERVRRGDVTSADEDRAMARLMKAAEDQLSAARRLRLQAYYDKAILQN